MRMLSSLVAILFALLSLGDKDHASWKAQWQVQAQSTSSQRKQSSNRQQRPSLHNQNHESTVRNVLQPRFASNENPLKSGNHTTNVAIIVSSSRYWFNYRHVTNALSIYHLLKRGGITDDNIILMLADDIPCNMRNPYRGKIFPRGTRGGDLMEDAEVDYSGTDVTVDAFLRVLLGRHLPGEERISAGSRQRHRRSWPRLDENTNILVYLTGHGGDNFFKFQDGEELMSNDVSSVFSQMYEMKRYNEILFISDTCQAFTMADEIKVPNVFSVGSSLKR
jgi:phosphatidylinositol glycan class K